tara:strand:- start:314 stop:520 length:207 start_codon:yes stop_codon:yes gene_type:complete
LKKVQRLNRLLPQVRRTARVSVEPDGHLVLVVLYEVHHFSHGRGEAALSDVKPIDYECGLCIVLAKEV